MVETERWIHTRSDGAIKINRGCVVARGVLRGHNGSWIIGFNRRLGKCFVFEVEL
ncbi:hypothetical protein Golob_027491 [Gossypium lobatum]|uniref:RNase H type-1 domain-containing protein n=1 Tax=Gossypium lobatum TaxID=34289 RepID=A0A7J8NKU3_9ROSI|nr:hypothetical protein [Gossypium lobatum]